LAEYEEKRKLNPKAKWDTYQSVKLITSWKQNQDLSYLRDVSIAVLQQSVLNLGRAFTNLFKGRAKAPRFKKRGVNDSIRLTKDAFRLKDKELYIAKVRDKLNVVYSRPLPDNLEPSSVTIRRTASNKWFVSFCYQDNGLNPLPQSGKVLGIDLGLEHFLTTSLGDKVDNPRFFSKYAKKLAHEQRKFSRKQKGSNNYQKQRVKVARVHEKIVNCRLDFLHKLSAKLIHENQVICIEDLCVKDMVVQGSKGLRKSILDASWSEFIRQLEYKAEWHGREVIKVDRYYPSSQTCSSCGVKTASKLNLSQRTWTCNACGTFHDRDVNAAKNILAAGQAVLACGAKGHV
jgi:putative transposase